MGSGNRTQLLDLQSVSGLCACSLWLFGKTPTLPLRTPVSVCLCGVGLLPLPALILHLVLPHLVLLYLSLSPPLSLVFPFRLFPAYAWGKEFSVFLAFPFLVPFCGLSGPLCFPSHFVILYCFLSAFGPVRYRLFPQVPQGP